MVTAYFFNMRNFICLFLVCALQRNVNFIFLVPSKAYVFALFYPSYNVFLIAQAEANALAQSISSLEESIVTEVVLESATAEERKSAEIRNLRLESYETQSELIAEEKSDLEEDLKIAKENEAKAKSKKSDAAAAVAAAVSKADASSSADAVKHAGLVVPLQKTLAEANNGFAMAQVLSGEAQARFDAEVAAAAAAENQASATKAGTATAAATAAEAAAAAAVAGAEKAVSGQEPPSPVREESKTIVPEAAGQVGEGTEKEVAAVAAATVPEAGSAAGGDLGAEAGGEEDKEGKKEGEESSESKEEEEEEEESGGSDELTVEELKALANFAGPSAVEEEKETFAKLKASEEALAQQTSNNGAASAAAGSEGDEMAMEQRAKEEEEQEATMARAHATDHEGGTSTSVEMDVAAAPVDATATAARVAKEALPEETPTPDPFAAPDEPDNAARAAPAAAGSAGEKGSSVESTTVGPDAGASTAPLSARASRNERAQEEAFYEGSASSTKEQSEEELQAALAAAAQEAAAAGADLAAAWQFKHEQDAATAAGYAAAVAAAPKADYAMGRLSQQLASMMNKLETDIAKVITEWEILEISMHLHCFSSFLLMGLFFFSLSLNILKGVFFSFKIYSCLGAVILTCFFRCPSPIPLYRWTWRLGKSFTS